ncbi:MAG: winged helix DNA-binding protein [Candidatus Lokiarchaeota archaeon]|nr:winged helix DNA-binding protein [Candidatus Harpocratesius repetitus]
MDDSEIEKWQIHSKILASKYMQKILIFLYNGPSTPNNLSNSLNLSASHTSTILKHLIEMDLLHCLTPNRRKGKLFGLTEKGIYYLENIYDDPF